MTIMVFESVSEAHWLARFESYTALPPLGVVNSSHTCGSAEDLSCVTLMVAGDVKHEPLTSVVVIITRTLETREDLGALPLRRRKTGRATSYSLWCMQ